MENGWVSRELKLIWIQPVGIQVSTRDLTEKKGVVTQASGLAWWELY